MRTQAKLKTIYGEVVLATLALVLMAIAAGPMAQSAQASTADCSGTLQSRINNAPAGSTINIAGCTFREQVTVNKALTIDGGGTARVKGSEIFSGFSASGGNYVSSQSVPTLSYVGEADDCADGVVSCLWEEQVFVNGVEQTQLANGSEPGPGEFKLDMNRKVVLGSDPSGKFVEVTTRESWLKATAAGVTVRGVNFAHLSNAPQTGGVVGNQGFQFLGGSVSHTHGVGIDLGTEAQATGVLVDGTHVHHTGHMGLKGTEVAATVRNLECHDINEQMFRPGWASGCMKNTKVKSLLVENNHVYDAYGHGFWCDNCQQHGAADNLIYQNNVIHDTTRAGIDVEISVAGRILDNVIYDAGYGDSSGWWGAGILSSSSSDFEIAGNVLFDNADGIMVLSANREQMQLVKNMYVHDNTVICMCRTTR